MKKVSSVLMAFFLAGVVYAQEKKDTIPVVTNQQSLGSKDTVPGLRKDTMPSWRMDTLNWNKDSMKSKNWDTLGVANNVDSLNNPTWKMNDSLRFAGNKSLQDTSAISSKTGTWQDTSAMVTDKKKLNNTSGITRNDKKMTNNEADTTATVKTKKVLKDRVMMKDGKMVIIKKGKETKMVKSIKLPDGNIVMMDGTIKMPDGNSVKLKEGEYINLKPAAGKGS